MFSSKLIGYLLISDGNILREQQAMYFNTIAIYQALNDHWYSWFQDNCNFTTMKKSWLLLLWHTTNISWHDHGFFMASFNYGNSITQPVVSWVLFHGLNISQNFHWATFIFMTFSWKSDCVKFQWIHGYDIILCNAMSMHFTGISYFWVYIINTWQHNLTNISLCQSFTKTA